MTIFRDARDYDDDRVPGWLSDIVCLLLAMANAIVWPVLLYVLVAP